MKVMVDDVVAVRHSARATNWESFMHRSYRSRGFSLIELVIVVIIIGIIGAIAIPRMSRGVEQAGDSALCGNLAVLRAAIDLYSTEHFGTFPAERNITAQLTEYSNDAGATNSGKTATYIWGPYIRTIPPLPVGAKKGATGIAAVDGASVGWIYDEHSGTISANCAATEVDARGVRYSTY
jgi:general secretion pathway protein G